MVVHSVEVAEPCEMIAAQEFLDAQLDACERKSRDAQRGRRPSYNDWQYRTPRPDRLSYTSVNRHLGGP